MNSRRFESLTRMILMSVGICMLVCGTSTQATNPNHRPGLVVAAKVTGNVEAISPDGKKTYKLKKHDRISEKYSVVTGMASAATLAFSNGAVINLLENTTMEISRFLQDPFASPFAATALSQEPTTSVTDIKLGKGEVVSTVKKLRTDEGSSLSITTPVGAAGVRGTTLAVSFQPPPSGNGMGTYTLSVTEGEVEFTDLKGNKRVVPAGKELVIRFRQTTDPVTGVITYEILEIIFQDIPADRKAMIDRVATEGDQASDLIFIDPLDRNMFNFFIPNAYDQFVWPPSTTLVDP